MVLPEQHNEQNNNGNNNNNNNNNNDDDDDDQKKDSKMMNGNNIPIKIKFVNELIQLCSSWILKDYQTLHEINEDHIKIYTTSILTLGVCVQIGHNTQENINNDNNVAHQVTITNFQRLR